MVTKETKQVYWRPGARGKRWWYNAVVEGAHKVLFPGGWRTVVALNRQAFCGQMKGGPNDIIHYVDPSMDIGGWAYESRTLQGPAMQAQHNRRNALDPNQLACPVQPPPPPTPSNQSCAHATGICTTDAWIAVQARWAANEGAWMQHRCVAHGR